MFNFHGPPRYLQNQLGNASSSSSNNSNINSSNGTKTRISVSDMGLNTLKHQQHQINSNGHMNFQSPSHSQSRSSNSVPLPPLMKTKSLTAAPTTRHGQRPPPDEPKKRPNHREMIMLTLKHVQSARGLNFEQLSSFIRGAFELAKSSALDSTLSKTLSNMVSRGYVIQIPGLGPYDATYQLAETPDHGLDLSVRGRSVQEIPCLYPTGYSLPNGKNHVCRTAQKQPDLTISMDMMGDGHHHYQHPGYGQDMNPYRRNPLTAKLDPMPYMPMADPMICQSFGQRMGLNCKAGEQRPNSPNLFDDQSSSNLLATTTRATYPRDPEFHCNYECHDNYNPEKGLWAPVLPKDDEDEDEAENSNDATTTTTTNQNNNTKCDELNDQEDQESSSNTTNPYPNTNQTSVPSLLDTFTESCTLEEFYQSGDDDDDEEEKHQNGTKILNIEEMKKKKNQSLNFVEGKLADSKNSKISNNAYSINSFVDDKLSRLASHRHLQNRMMTTKKGGGTGGVPCKTLTTGRIQMDHETDPLENFDIFASYGAETKEEFESNNRSCQIMNDFSQKGTNDLKDEFENRMDYLYGVADIIDNYKEPLNIRQGGTGTDKNSSKSKTYRKNNK